MINSGRISSLSIALCIARMEAFRIFIPSISSLLTSATAHANASFSMKGRNASRTDSVNCLESLSWGHTKPGGRITAAATTGPARQPRPASSHPHSYTNTEKLPFRPVFNLI